MTTGKETAHPANLLLTFIQYSILSVVWFALIVFFAENFAITPFWIVVVSVYLFSIPIILCGIYGNTINQIRSLHLFDKKGWIFRFIASRPLKILFWVCWALCTSFFILVQFHTFSRLEWGLFFLVIPVFWLVFIKVQKAISHELKPYLVYGMALSWSRRLCPLIMLLLYVIFHLFFSETITFNSLEEAIKSKQDVVADMTGSALVQEVSQYLAVYEGIKAYALSRLGSQEALLPVILLGFGNLVIFYNACAVLTCFLIPAKEYRRIFGPLSDAAVPEAVPWSRIAVISAVTAFLSLFIYLPSFSYVELYFQQTPELSLNRKKAQIFTVQKLEQIDETFFKEGTIDKLQKARIEALHKTEVALVRLEGQTDRAFDRMEANVDNYLDWYYSLVGEYTRIGNLLVGELENYMVEKLKTTLQQGDAFQEVQASLDQLFIDYENAQKVYQNAVQEIMNENRVVDKEPGFRVVKKIAMEDVFNLPIHQDMVDLQNRLVFGVTGGAVAGVLTAVIVKKILGKVMGKNLIKIAAKTLSKIVISKTAGTATGAGAGAAIGAVIGSVVPGPGTAAGAAIGGVVGGIVVGVSVDKILIELEEAMSREKFKGEMLSAIQDARLEVKDMLRL